MLFRLCTAGLLLGGGLLSAQSVKVFSEFQRVDPFGEIVAADRDGQPREILSPLLARNSHASFHIVVGAPPGRYFHLYVQASTEDVLKIDVYKEMYERHGNGWIPDRLLPVTLPHGSQLPDTYQGIKGQTVECFLLDIWVPPDAPVERIAVVVQVHVGGRWAIYPMEMRVAEAAAPPFEPPDGPLPRVTAPADAATLGPLKSYLCGQAERGHTGDMSVRQIIRRNALEDLALAQSLEKHRGRDAVTTGILKPLGVDPASFCATRQITSPFGPEWYLRSRDFLYRGAIN